MGKLILLGLPIGNLGDLTDRVKNALIEGENFVVEDTRSFGRLLSLLGIKRENKKFISFHDHSNQKKTEFLLSKLDAGETLYLASEAGSPLISDPGYPLVRKALAKGHQLESYPGISSVPVALELSGLPPLPFGFHGFLPRKKEAKKKFISSLPAGTTHIFFEGKSRVENSLQILSETHPHAQVAVCRELTKKFQKTHRFLAKDLDTHLKNISLKGEFVLLFYINQ
ncbi:MAG: rRNA small subunit methyltransferase 1 [Halobacteriovoraceae bacterium]|nr:rRNA small subunit methyltransferase 1 [Halobacteriovoraceae bacterium]